MIKLDDEGMIKEGHNSFLVFYDVFFLVIADKSFEHNLHGIELSVTKTTDQIDFAKTTDGQAFAYFVFFETTFRYILDAVERCLTNEHPLSD